jgi:hypothetical protein
MFPNIGVFMPLFVILFVLLFTSCQKKNDLSESGYKSALEQRAFLSIKNEENQSILRKHILNSIVEEKFPLNFSDNQIKNYDELKGYEMDPKDLREYSSKEVAFSKVIVSYTDHYDIFFLPENVPFEMIISKLNLSAEQGRIFKWLKTNATKTIINQSFYLASVNLDDIVKNDQDFFNKEIELNNNYENSVFKVAQGKSVRFTVDYKTYQQGTSESRFTGRTITCKRDMLEVGMCDQCKYSKAVPSSSYNEIGSKLSESIFKVKLSGKTFQLNELNFEEKNSNQFVISLDTGEFDIGEDLEIEILSMQISPLGMNTEGYNYANTCIDRAINETITLDRKIESKIQLKVMGRGREFLKNIL